MSELPAVSGRRMVKVLERAGFELQRVRGSHHVMVHPDGRFTAVPVHGNRDLPKGTLRGILRASRLDVDDLRRLL